MSCPVLLNFLAVPTSSTDPITAFDVSHSRRTFRNTIIAINQLYSMCN